MEYVQNRIKALPFLKARGYWSLAAYGRFFIPELCSGYRQVIYADIDMAFNRDIAELMAVDLGDNYIAGSPELIEECKRYFDAETREYLPTVLKIQQGEPYINSGLIIFNIEMWLKLSLAKKAFALLKEKELRIIDQDAINSVCRGKILLLEQGWNVLIYPKENFLKDHESLLNGLQSAYVSGLLDGYHAALAARNSVIHYNQPEKPWHNTDVPEADYWWFYAEKTELYQQYLRSFLNNQRKYLMAEVEKANRRLSHLSPPEYEKVSIFGIPLLTVKRKTKKRIYKVFNMRIIKKEWR